ncbi:MAG: hypothetical protein JWO03_1677, partial [Bacteroidetes bacterium]|nr:hypothetical protein [Bacteroidota bacterium]
HLGDRPEKNLIDHQNEVQGNKEEQYRGSGIPVCNKKQDQIEQLRGDRMHDHHSPEAAMGPDGR